MKTLRQYPALFWLAVASTFVHVVVVAACLFLPAKELPVLPLPGRGREATSAKAVQKPSPLGGPVKSPRARTVSFHRASR